MKIASIDLCFGTNFKNIDCRWKFEYVFCEYEDLWLMIGLMHKELDESCPNDRTLNLFEDEIKYLLRIWKDSQMFSWDSKQLNWGNN